MTMINKDKVKAKRLLNWCKFGAAFGVVYTLAPYSGSLSEMLSINLAARCAGGAFGGVILFGIAASIKNSFN